MSSTEGVGPDVVAGPNARYRGRRDRRLAIIKKQDVKPHDLRRTFGTWFLQANPGHVRELAELMGHSDLSQVMKYALSDEQRARAGVAKL
jgi:integrase